MSVYTDTVLKWELLMTSKFSPQLISFFLGGVVLVGIPDSESHGSIAPPAGERYL